MNRIKLIFQIRVLRRLIICFFSLAMFLVGFDEEIIQRFDFEKYKEAAKIGTVSYGIVALTSAASTFAHEMGHAGFSKFFFNSPINIVLGNPRDDHTLINLKFVRVNSFVPRSGGSYFSPGSSFNKYEYLRFFDLQKTVAGFHIKPKSLPLPMRLKLLTIDIAGPLLGISSNYLLYKSTELIKNNNKSLELSWYELLFKMTIIYNGYNNAMNLLPMSKNADGYKILKLLGMSNTSIGQIKNPSINIFLILCLLLNYNDLNRGRNSKYETTSEKSSERIILNLKYEPMI